MASRYPEADLTGLKRTSIAERGGLIHVESFVRPQPPGDEFDRFVLMVPDLFGGRDFHTASRAIVDANARGRGVLVMFGAHFIKCGLSRLLIDLMERGVVTAVATNGAGAIHDYEIAMFGLTSEDVAVHLPDGSFGMCAETADGLNGAVSAGHREGLGFGESVGRALTEMNAPHADTSVLAAAYRLGIPATVHVAVGTDIVHQHASADGEAIGATSLRDMRILARALTDVDDGAVLNVGSAVILPEVFLKALSIARNLGTAAGRFTAISLDMNEPYRALTNVVRRPTAQGGTGLALRGRHELLFPLLWSAVVRGITRGTGA